VSPSLDAASQAYAYANSVRYRMTERPWVASVLGQVGLAYLGPNLIRQSERMLALFEAAGFAPGETDQAMNTLIAYVIGMTTSEAAYLSMLARSGQTEHDWLESLRPAAEQALKDHPRLREGYSPRDAEDPQRLRDTNFVYGVDRVLDGLETRLASAG
jgi:hypothetical protein